MTIRWSEALNLVRRVHRTVPRVVMGLLAAISVSAPAGDAHAQGSVVTDRAALVALYNATGGLGWTNSTNWLTNAPVGEWFGVTTTASERVTALDLPGNGLTRVAPGRAE